MIGAKSVPALPKKYSTPRAARSSRYASAVVSMSAFLLTGLPSAETESLQVWSGGERKVGRDDRRPGRATLARRETASMRPAPPDKTRGPDRPQDDAPSAQAGQSANQ